MKKNIFLAVAAAVMLLFTACNKDVDLNGTKWHADFGKTVNYQGIDAEVALSMDLAFTSETAYSMSTTSSVTLMGQTHNEGPETSVGTYTFDGKESGMFDGEQPFTYNKKDKTITVSQTLDEESAAIFGTNTITLTFNKK